MRLISSIAVVSNENVLEELLQKERVSLGRGLLGDGKSILMMKWRKHLMNGL